MRKRSKMFREIHEIPDVITNMIEYSESGIIAAAKELRLLNPSLITTTARGSSDHAAAYLKYAIELHAGVPVASLGPSIASIYHQQLKLNASANISISQSGQSPDIVKMNEMTGRGGALNIAITNDVSSPLALSSKYAIDIAAGEEKSVAATKTFVASIYAGLLLLAHWQEDEKLLSTLRSLPDYIRIAIDCDWSPMLDGLANNSSLYILGRGPGMAIANEAALKFKETCQIHAQAYSSAEVMHGPKSIVGDDFTVLALTARDPSEQSIIKVADALAAQGARVFATTKKEMNATPLPFVASGHPLTDALLLIISYYVFIEKLARSLGHDPDQPPHLKKVTETI